MAFAEESRSRAGTRALTAALAAALVVGLGGCIDVETTLLCEGAWCNHRGECEDDGVEARCSCDEGFAPVPGYLRCVPGDGEHFAFIEFPMSVESFWMGSPNGEPGRADDERALLASLTDDFVIQSTEVTVGQFHELMGYVPSQSALDPTDAADLDRPVDWVSWHQAAAYCNQLSRGAHYEQCYDCGGGSAELRPDVSCVPAPDFPTPYACGGYRLPTEAEWEYAARAGTTTATYNGDLDPAQLGCDSAVVEPIAAYCGNANRTRAVAQGEPSAWGSYGDGGDGRLYDMLGNVAEWCHDWYAPYDGDNAMLPWGPPAEVDGQGRVYRGGSFQDEAVELRAARRSHAAPNTRNRAIGFRVVRTFVPL